MSDRARGRRPRHTPPPQNAWTRQQLKQLRQLTAEGGTTAQIASQIGKSELAVRRKRKELGIKRPRQWSLEEVSTLKMRAGQRLPARRIAAELGKTEYNVRKMCERLGLAFLDDEPRTAPWSAEDDALLRRLHAEGKSRGEMAIALDRPLAAVSHREGVLGLAPLRRGTAQWTKKEDTTLRKKAAAGERDGVIAAALNRSLYAVAVRRRRLGIRRPPASSRLDTEAVKREAEALWSQGIKPTRGSIAERLNVEVRHVYRGFYEWRRTCGRSALQLKRGPLASLNMRELSGRLAGAVARAPLTCLDPSNDGRWKEPPENTVLYLSNIRNASLRNTLALYAMLMSDRSAESVYLRVTHFHGIWNSMLEGLGIDDVAEVDPDDVIFRIWRGEAGHGLSDRKRASIISIWTAVANAQRDYLDRLSPAQQEAIGPYCIRQILDRRKLNRESHWATNDQARRQGVKELTDHVHDSFHRIRFAAAVRLNAIKRMHEATQSAIAQVNETGTALPFGYSYEETFVDADGRATRQRVFMELWDFRALFDEAVEQGYGASRERLRRYDRGLPPFDRTLYVPRYLRTEMEDGSPGRELWLLEFVKSEVLTGTRPGGRHYRKKEEFNRRWGYPAGMNWGSKANPVSWSLDKCREVRFLSGKGYLFIRVEEFYRICLYAALAIRIQTVTGARLGEVQQVAATRECIILLKNVGPKRRSRYALRLIPKGHKKRSTYFIDDDTKDVLRLLVAELRRVYGVKKLPIVKPQFSKLLLDRYVFQSGHIVLPQETLNVMMRVLLHGVIIHQEMGKVVVLKSHALRHAFATELAALGVGTDVIAALLNQKDLRVTKHYSRPTQSMVRDAAEMMFVDQIDVGPEALRGKDEVERMVKDAEGTVGALGEVIGGGCVIGIHCPIKFACVGCPGNAPDPEKRGQVVAKKEWAIQQKEWAQEQSLKAEERQMENLIANCELMLAEMTLIQIQRMDAKQSAPPDHVGSGGEGKDSQALFELAGEAPSALSVTNHAEKTDR
ncbi:MAG TPA: tyrosine-type recombinase/integrase [Blastocatellia bacterium]|nr:tyrosine-type recombinase/integrase [Blastocatellia bacterium]